MSPSFRWPISLLLSIDRLVKLDIDSWDRIESDEFFFCYSIFMGYYVFNFCWCSMGYCFNCVSICCGFRYFTFILLLLALCPSMLSLSGNWWVSSSDQSCTSEASVPLFLSWWFCILSCWALFKLKSWLNWHCWPFTYSVFLAVPALTICKAVGKRLLRLLLSYFELLFDGNKF